MISKTLQAKLDRLPVAPGVYLMRDHKGKVIYVGKAVNLRARVRSYFNRGAGDERLQVPFLVDQLEDVEVLVVGSEKEALLLENELIKKYKPRFNVLLRDDKAFITLRLDTTHAFPRLEVWRRPDDDGARYFGPYSSAAAVRETLRVVNRHFQLRTCTDATLNSRKRPCLQFQIGRCPAPCVYEVPDYEENVRDAILFLEGRHTDLADRLRNRMKAASDAMAYEVAARLRDQILAVERTLERQQVVQVEGRRDRDVVGVHREGPFLGIQLLFVRGGRMSGGRSFSYGNQAFPTDELVHSFLQQYYQGGQFVPDEVLLPAGLEDRSALADWLTERRGRRVDVIVPQRGEKKKLVELACENARTSFEVQRSRSRDLEEVLGRLQRTLGLRNFPRRIEGYDISQIQGTNAVASRVALTDGEADKSRYRRYKIRDVQGQDDFAMMREVLTRRLLRGLEEGDLPDLLVIDGGKGQLNVARAVLADVGVTEVDVIGLAKSRVQGDGADDEGARDAEPAEAEGPAASTGAGGAPAEPSDGSDAERRTARSPERVFLPGRKDPVVLPQNSAELFVLTRLRDEAHRFAITFQRQLRGRRTLRSALDRIEGIGPGRRKALLKHFGSIKRLREAAVEDIAEVEGFSTRMAERVFEGLRKD